MPVGHSIQLRPQEQAQVRAQMRCTGLEVVAGAADQGPMGRGPALGHPAASAACRDATQQAGRTGGPSLPGCRWGVGVGHGHRCDAPMLGKKRKVVGICAQARTLVIARDVAGADPRECSADGSHLD